MARAMVYEFINAQKQKETIGGIHGTLWMKTYPTNRSNQRTSLSFLEKFAIFKNLFQY